MGKVLQFLLIFVAQVPDDGLMTAVEGADALLECKVSGEDVVPSEEINGTVQNRRERKGVECGENDETWD